MPHVLGVAATDTNGNLAALSNTGSANVAAPGTGIRTTNANGGYSSITGTSAAVAHVAGEAALLAASGKASTYIYDQIRWATAPVAGQSFGRINVKNALGAALTGPAGTKPAAPARGASAPVYTAAGTLVSGNATATTLANGATAATLIRPQLRSNDPGVAYVKTMVIREFCRDRCLGPYVIEARELCAGHIKGICRRSALSCRCGGRG